MKRIPVLRFHESEFIGKRFDATNIHEFMGSFKEKTLYIIDEGGIQKNHPQVNVYQHLAKTYELWVDSGPRETGDIVDLVFSGVERIVIRPSLWQEIDLKNVRNMTGHQLFQLYEISVEERDSMEHTISLVETFDGVVVYIQGDWKQRRFKSEQDVKRIAHMAESYVYDSSDEHADTWEKYGFTGMLVDHEYFMESLR